MLKNGRKASFTFNLNESDTVAWRGTNDGDFIVKSAYEIISGNNNLHVDPLFQLIWICDGLERIRVFLWQVVVGALPTNYYRFSRNIFDDPTCS